MVAAGAAVSIALLVGFGIERKGVHLDTGSGRPKLGRVGAMTPQEQQ